MNIVQIFWNSRPSFANKPMLIVDGKDVSFDDLADHLGDILFPLEDDNGNL